MTNYEFRGDARVKTYLKALANSNSSKKRV